MEEPKFRHQKPAVSGVCVKISDRYLLIPVLSDRVLNDGVHPNSLFGSVMFVGDVVRSLSPRHLSDPSTRLVLRATRCSAITTTHSRRRTARD